MLFGWFSNSKYLQSLSDCLMPRLCLDWGKLRGRKAHSIEKLLIESFWKWTTLPTLEAVNGFFSQNCQNQLVLGLSENKNLSSSFRMTHSVWLTNSIREFKFQIYLQIWKSQIVIAVLKVAHLFIWLNRRGWKVKINHTHLVNHKIVVMSKLTWRPVEWRSI